jgi:hypothetical protein
MDTFAGCGPFPVKQVWHISTSGVTVVETGALTHKKTVFRLLLRKDFQPSPLARLTPLPDSLAASTGLLVSIIAFDLG